MASDYLTDKFNFLFFFPLLQPTFIVPFYDILKILEI